MRDYLTFERSFRRSHAQSLSAFGAVNQFVVASARL